MSIERSIPREQAPLIFANTRHNDPLVGLEHLFKLVLYFDKLNFGVIGIKSGKYFKGGLWGELMETLYLLLF